MYEIIFLLFRNIFRSETARLLLRITFWRFGTTKLLNVSNPDNEFFFERTQIRSEEASPLQPTVFLWSLYPLGIWHLLTGWHSVGQSGMPFKKRCAQKADTGSETSRGWLQVVFLTAFSPHPTPPSFSFSSSDQLSRGCISYFTKHKRKNTPKKMLATYAGCVCGKLLQPHTTVPQLPPRCSYTPVGHRCFTSWNEQAIRGYPSKITFFNTFMSSV